MRTRRSINLEPGCFSTSDDVPPRPARQYGGDRCGRHTEEVSKIGARLPAASERAQRPDVVGVEDRSAQQLSVLQALTTMALPAPRNRLLELGQAARRLTSQGVV